LDVCFVFRRLTDVPAIRARLTSAAGGTLDEAYLDQLAVLALLHDLGKTNLGFQTRPFDPAAPRAGHILELGPLLFEPELAARFRPVLEKIMGWFARPEDCESYLLATWSHHGQPLSLVKLQERTGNYYRAKTTWWQPDREGRDPFLGIEELFRVARETFPQAFSLPGRPLPAHPALQHRFAGLVMLADWLGSHESFFPIERLSTFSSQTAAERAVELTGLETTPFRRQWASGGLSFDKLFGFPPRPLQETLQDLALESAKSRLLVIEAETGSGKTEAALARFACLFAAGQVDSLYFALPTRVAAREIYGRVVKWLARNFPEENNRPAAVLAVPGYARVDNVLLETLLPSRAECYDEEEQRHAERLWAAERPKRFLAAAVAVGTIDQALLSAVQVRHAHLRSVCLDRSLLVVDEVHASDPYMRSLLERLLSHHIGLGGHALLLSATLGAHARTRLLNAAGGQADDPSLAEACATVYPAATDLAGTPQALGRTAGRPKKVRFVLEPWLERPEWALEMVAEALAVGGRVLVVLNTVARAIALQRAAEAHPRIRSEALFSVRKVICPHHGRFAPVDREILDEAVSERLGKESTPGSVLLIGTQTLEQSLDIDADLLVTDLCPADVLLQRVGRLHRHERPRPAGCEEARCLVLTYEPSELRGLVGCDGEAAGQAKAAGLGSVYDDLRTLELTRRRLAELVEVALPDDNRYLVEMATHPDCLRELTNELTKELGDERWLRHEEKIYGAVLAQELAAQFAAALYQEPFGEVSFRDIQGESKARTRLGLDSLRVTLASQVPSPFGAPLGEVIIPGHLAPSRGGDEAAEVLGTEDGVVQLRLGDRTYRYSRLGLEGQDGAKRPTN
jgi:CRISPR-associated endonuclease/helicase Cas3